MVADTCMVVCPLEEMGYTVTGTDSGKAAAYLPNLCKQKVAFGDIEDILIPVTRMMTIIKARPISKGKGMRRGARQPGRRSVSWEGWTRRPGQSSRRAIR